MNSQVVTRLTARAAALPPRVQDLALALALVLVNAASVLPYRSQLHPFWAALVLVIAQCVPLAWRRRWPLAVLIVAGIPRILYDQLAFAYAPFPLANTIAFYTAMVYCRPAVRRVVILLVVIGSIESQVSPGHTQPYDAVVSALTTLGAWGAAVVVRNRQASVRVAESRAERAEAERDDDVARAAAAERTRIARELHDVVAHHVSLMAVQAEAATSLLPGRPSEAAQSVEVIAATARQALTELRRLLGVLRGPADQLETAPAMSLTDLGAVLDQVRGSGLTVDLEVEGTPGPLAPSVDLTAYRIIQEALTNTVRHANAARAVVTLSFEPGFITVNITDTRRDAGTVPVVNGTAARAVNGTPVDGIPVDGSAVDGSAERTAAGIGTAGNQAVAGPVRRLRPGRHRGTGRLLRRQPRGGAHRLRRVRGHGPAAGPVSTMSAASGPSPIRVLVADDQELVRAGFCVILEAADGISVVGEASNGADAVAAVAAHHPDVVLMDIRMPGMDGLEATRLITQGGPDAGPKVVMLTTFDLDDYVYEALRSGASGFLLKDAPRGDLIAAVQAAAAGNGLLAPSVTRMLIESFARRPAAAVPAPTRLASLTAREKDILLLVARGRSNAEIARELFVGEATVKTHIGHLLAKLGLRDRVQAVILAYETGLVVPGDFRD